MPLPTIRPLCIRSIVNVRNFQPATGLGAWAFLPAKPGKNEKPYVHTLDACVKTRKAHQGIARSVAAAVLAYWAVRWMGVCSLEAKTILSLFKTAATEKPNALALRVESSGNSWSCWTYKQSEHSPSSVPPCRYVTAPSASCCKSLGECFGVDRPGPSAHPYSESTSTT